MKHAYEDPQGAAELEGRYANYFKVGHNAFEFLLDFGQLYADSQRARLHTRIITNPVYAKALFETLGASIKRYEDAFSTIPAEDQAQGG